MTNIPIRFFSVISGVPRSSHKGARMNEIIWQYPQGACQILEALNWKLSDYIFPKTAGSRAKNVFVGESSKCQEMVNTSPLFQELSFDFCF